MRGKPPGTEQAEPEAIGLGRPRRFLQRGHVGELRVALGYPGVLGQLWPDSSGDPTATGLAALGITAGEGWFGFRPLPGEPWETLDAAWIAEVAQ